MASTRVHGDVMTLATRAATAFLAAGTSYFTLLSWDGLSDRSRAFLVPLFWVAVFVAGTGLALRARRVTAPFVVLGQVLVAGLLVHHQWGVGDALGGWLPTGDSLASSGTVLRRAVGEAQQYAAPLPTSATDFAALMLLAGTGVVLVVDLLACTARRVPLAGLPLLATFTAPVTLLGGVSWLTFALGAVCFVLLLAADHASRLGQWGRSLSGPVTDTLPSSVGLHTVWPTATRIGVAGIAVAVLAPALLPTGGGILDGNGPGDGSGGGDEVTIENPMVDLRRDLRRGEDIELLRVQTDDPDPRYLRFSVLDEFDGRAWLPAERDLTTANDADGPLPPPPGLDPEVPTTTHRWTMSASDQFNSSWLPIPFPATEVEVAGDWRFEERTLDVMTPDEGASTAGLSYSAVGETVEVDAEALVTAPPPNRTVFMDDTRLPASVPSWLKELAEEVTKDAHSPFERAVLLQRWFREDGGFEYSIARSDDGNGTEQLARFLGNGDDSRVGYCEQFAAAMALLAREVGIPARVAVGFLRPDRQGNTWVYSAYDMHAWPELYFQGAGWLRFEPTPAQEDVAAPAYTSGRVPQPEDVSTPSTPVQTDAPDSAPTQKGGADTSATDGGASTVLHWVGRVGLGLLVLALLAVPALVRVLQRRRRLAPDYPGGVAEGAWAEVRATAIDLRLGWDDAATLRRRARALVPALAPSGHGPGDVPAPDSPEAWVDPVEALQRLVLLVERSRFSRTGLPEQAQEEVPQLAETVTAAMVRAAKPSTRRRATWLPASLWSGGRSGPLRRNGSSGDHLTDLDRVSV